MVSIQREGSSWRERVAVDQDIGSGSWSGRNKSLELGALFFFFLDELISGEKYLRTYCTWFVTVQCSPYTRALRILSVFDTAATSSRIDGTSRQWLAGGLCSW